VKDAEGVKGVMADMKELDIVETLKDERINMPAL